MITVIHALKGLDKKTPLFFRREALSDPDLTSKFESMRILRSTGDKQVIELLKDILRGV